MSQPRPCPTCGRPVEPPPEAGRPPDRLYPFCSSRCRLIDLGKWLRGEYVIPGSPGQSLAASAAAGGDGEEPA
jgi:hypothetical protein